MKQVSAYGPHLRRWRGSSGKAGRHEPDRRRRALDDLADGKVECYTKFSPMPLDGPTVSNDPVFITLHDGDFVATERSTGTGLQAPIDRSA